MACVALTAVTYGVIGYGFVDIASLAVVPLDDPLQEPFELAINATPVLVVSWDCPECRQLLTDLQRRSARGIPLAVVFTRPEWLEPDIARQTALVEAQELGLLDDPDITLYLDDGFQVQSVPALLIRYPESRLSRLLLSPSLGELDRVLQRFRVHHGS
jgi:hypothetical protein